MVGMQSSAVPLPILCWAGFGYFGHGHFSSDTVVLLLHCQHGISIGLGH